MKKVKGVVFGLILIACFTCGWIVGNDVFISEPEPEIVAIHQVDIGYTAPEPEVVEIHQVDIGYTAQVDTVVQFVSYTKEVPLSKYFKIVEDSQITRTDEEILVIKMKHYWGPKRFEHPEHWLVLWKNSFDSLGTGGSKYIYKWRDVDLKDDLAIILTYKHDSTLYDTTCYQLKNCEVPR